MLALQPDVAVRGQLGEVFAPGRNEPPVARTLRGTSGDQGWTVFASFGFEVLVALAVSRGVEGVEGPVGSSMVNAFGIVRVAGVLPAAFVTEMVMAGAVESLVPQIGGSALFPGNAVCLLYTSDAADDLLRVDLGGPRSI